MNILIAPNAFKNSLDANAVAQAIGKGLQQSKFNCMVHYFPIGDGGDGTGDLIIQHTKGNVIDVDVHDALGRKIKSSFGLIDDDKTAVIELANASGIKLLQQDELNPLQTTTFGTGELIQQALNKNVNKIILCIGGSATVDGGAGILQALGLKFLDDKHEVINTLPENLIHLSSIDESNFDQRILNCELIILCDVENILLGEQGSAKIFGPQKGATQKQVSELEAILIKLRDVTLQQKGIDISAIQHGGAAGGVAAGLFAYCNAKLVKGIDYFLSITRFDNVLQTADVLITGEGKIDEQTLQGKAPYGVAAKAKEKNIPVIAVAGNVPLENNDALNKYFDVLLSINNEITGLKTALFNTEVNLMRTGKLIGNMLALNKNS